MPTITEETGSMSDRSSQVQTQERTGTQTSISAPGERVSRQTDAGTKAVTTTPASMQVSFEVEFVSSRPG